MIREARKTILFWLVAWVGLAMPCCAGRVSIRLERERELAVGAVTLGQVASIEGVEGAQRDRLETLVVAEFEAGTVQGQVGAFEITRALARAGVAPASVDIYGASMCRVRLMGQSDAVENEADSVPAVEELTKESAWTLADELTAMVGRLRGVKTSKLKVEWQCADPTFLQGGAEGDRFEIIPESTAMLGHVRFAVLDREASRGSGEGGEPRSPVRVYGRVEQLCEIVCAVRRIEPGEVIGRDAVRLMPVRVSSRRELGCSRVEAVIGQEAARSIDANEAIEESMVRKLQLVKRGDTVTVRSQVGPVHVTARGEARGDAGLGDEVPVRRGRNRTIVYGVVTGPGEVTVSPPEVSEAKVAAVVENAMGYARREERN